MLIHHIIHRCQLVGVLKIPGDFNAPLIDLTNRILAPRICKNFIAEDMGVSRHAAARILQASNHSIFVNYPDVLSFEILKLCQQDPDMSILFSGYQGAQGRDI